MPTKSSATAKAKPKTQPRTRVIEVLPDEPVITAEQRAEMIAAMEETRARLLAEPTETVYVQKGLSVSPEVTIGINGVMWKALQGTEVELPKSVATLLKTRMAAIPARDRALNN